jgi:hypothetical protein
MLVNFMQRILSMSKQHLFFELVGSWTWLEVANASLVSIEAEVDILLAAAFNLAY